MSASLLDSLFCPLVGQSNHCVRPHCRRKETEKAAKEKGGAKKKAPPPKKPAKKPTADETLAKTLASRRESVRDRDKKGVKSKKAAALAALKKERRIQQQQQDDSSDDSEMDFGDDDDSDEDYEAEPLKPWQKKTRAAKSAVSRLEKHDEDSAEDMDIDDEDGSEGSQKAKPKMAKSPSDKGAAAEAEAGLEDFLKVTIPRRRLARWCNEPFFNASALECYVRLFIGENESGEKVYRLCEIIDVNATNKIYKFPVVNRNEKPVATNKTLKLKFGTSERDFPMYLVSDAVPEEIDIVKYIAAQKNNRLPVLTKRRAAKLHRLQNNLVQNYTYTTEDIERNLEHRRKQGTSASNLGSEQTRVAIAVQAAQESVKDAEKRVNEAKKALMEADNPASAQEAALTAAIREAEKAFGEVKKDLEVRLEEERTTKDVVHHRRQRLTQRKKDMNWAEVNKRALEANQRADREALKLAEEAKMSGGKREAFNPYARRKVKPKILWEVGQNRDKEEAKEEKISEEETPKENNGGIVDIGTPKLVRESNGKAALLDRHQFAIDEESLAKSSTLESLLDGTARSLPKRSRIRKGLSLTEYLERKEAGTLYQ
jgi:RNA polymerase-associated protein RTF1